jgi:hypothetical protein
LVGYYFVGYHPSYDARVCSIGPYVPKFSEIIPHLKRASLDMGLGGALTDEVLDTLAAQDENQGIKIKANKLKAYRENKIAYFSKKFNRFAGKRGEIEKFAIESMTNYMLAHIPKEYLDVIDPSKDFDLIYVVDTSAKKKEGGKQNVKNKVVVPASSPEYGNMSTTNPLLSNSPGIQPSAKIPLKILQRAIEIASKDKSTYSLKEAYDAFMNEKAASSGISKEEMLKLAENDFDILADVYKHIKDILDKKIASGDFNALILPPLPNIDIASFKDSMKRIPIFGQVGYTESGPSKANRCALMLKKEILEIMERRKTEDPVEIAEDLNSRRNTKKLIDDAGGKGDASKFSINIVNFWLTEIGETRFSVVNGKKVEKTIRQMIDETKNELGLWQTYQKDKGFGFDNIDSALRMASLHFYGKSGEEDQDPLTKAYLLTDFSAPVFARGEDSPEIKSEDLKILKEALTQKIKIDTNNQDMVDIEEIEKLIATHAPAVEIDLPEIPEFTSDPEDVSDILGEIPEETEEISENMEIPKEDDVVEETEQIEQVEQIEPSIQKDVQPETSQEVQQTVEENEEEDQLLKGLIESEDEKDIFASTIKRLVVIAKKLDNEGNHKDSEEVHKIIRKYAGKL